MSANLITLLIEATGQTLYMVAISALLGTLLGLPLGLFLATSQRGELLSAPWGNKILGLVVNACRLQLPQCPSSPGWSKTRSARSIPA